MSRERFRKALLPPGAENIEKLKNIIKEGNYYGAQQMYKTTSARYATVGRFKEALELLQSGACLQLEHEQVTCGGELAVLFVDMLVKAKVDFDQDYLDRIRTIYKKFPRIPLPQNLDLADDDAIHNLSETLGAAKIRVESCSSFLKAAIKWSSESGPRKLGSAELHDMLAEYIYSESPEPDMARVCFHFSRGRNPNRFASTLVNCMGKCYLGEDDLAIARAILMYLSIGWLLLAVLGIHAISASIRYLNLLEDIGEKFYGVRRKNPLQGMFGELFKTLQLHLGVSSASARCSTYNHEVVLPKELVATRN
ncbi:Golgi to ER traffic protein 4 [Tanacetum coccineum]